MSLQAERGTVMQLANARKRAAIGQHSLVRCKLIALVVISAGLALSSARGYAAETKIDDQQQDMKWIWSPAQPQEKIIPAGSCYFRKTFTLGQAESGEVQIACDNAYELYVNGRL